MSLQVRPGEFVAIVGPSGSGKSTLMRLLLGFESPDSGTVTYDGRELATLDVREVRRQIGVVLQQVGGLFVEALRMQAKDFRGPHGQRAIDEDRQAL